MTRRRHVDALARILESSLDSQEAPRARRRLLEVDLAWVRRHADDGCERPRGMLRLRRVVETCRDEHLASLDADDGLTVLGIGWEEVVLALLRGRRERSAVTRRRCPRCGEQMEARERVRLERGVARTVYRCGACGLSPRN